MCVFPSGLCSWRVTCFASHAPPSSLRERCSYCSTCETDCRLTDVRDRQLGSSPDHTTYSGGHGHHIQVLQNRPYVPYRHYRIGPMCAMQELQNRPRTTIVASLVILSAIRCAVLRCNAMMRCTILCCNAPFQHRIVTSYHRIVSSHRIIAS